MSKMKHLLQKLHIGGGGGAGAGALTDHPPHHHHHRGGGHHSRHNHNRSRTPETASPAEQQQQASSTSDLPSRDAASAATTTSATSVGVVEYADSSNSVPSSGGNESAGDAVPDFGLLEEEFQVQLALAMSASDSHSREDPETTAQIQAAQQISMACLPSLSLVDFQSLRYWNYDVVNYNEKVVDGFYDVYGINSSLVAQGKMPSLVELQSIPVVDDHNYEVIIVDRTTDLELQNLEEKVSLVATEYQALRVGALMGFFVQKIANVVVEKMGGPVTDSEQMLRRWTARSYDLRILLNTIVLPLGSLDIGLSRQRALLFKVLADRINLPCMLIKGSYYTSTDDGAFSIIRFDDGSEYIIDLMAAPGTLIPSEIPSSQLQTCGLDIRTITPVADALDDSCFDFGGPTRSLSVIPVNKVPAKPISSISEPYFGGMISLGNCGSASEITETVQYGHEFGNAIPSLVRHKASPVEQIQIEDISKLPRENSSMQSPLTFKVQEVIEKDLLLKVGKVYDGHCQPQLCKPNIEQAIIPFSELQFRYDAPFTPDPKSSVTALATQKQGQLSNVPYQSNQLGNFSSDVADVENVNDQNIQINDVLMKRKDASPCSQSSLRSQDEQVDPLLGGVAEWEIPWEDLQIGERIGIGSYGEVYRSDWNGTEVAVKKFMNQDISGDALVQFKCEVEIMLRLRHPNFVLFMGAVTRPPNLSILTEFLPRGSLFKLLHRSNVQLDEKRRLRMALDVAKGMNYLHTSHPVIVHRDLKTPNLLVDKNWVVKVCDFGMSRMKHHTFLSSKSTAGTAEWMAPEVLRNEPSNEKSDVFSFGVILWELATLDVPWTGMNSMQVVGAVGFQGRRLTIPDRVDPVVAEIIRNCWDSNQQARPPFKEIIARLKSLERLVVQNADPETEQQ